MIPSARILLPGLLLLLWGTACQRRTAPAESPLPPAVAETAPPAEEATIPPGDPSVPYIVLALHKTPCFGHCPVFQATVYSDGTAVWHGEKYHARLGDYKATASPAWLAEVMEAAVAQQYFSLANAYPTYGGAIPDLPTTITVVSSGRKSHSVSNNADAPTGLLRFEKLLEEKLDALNWRRSD